jgi:AcrR family transcriptional regulator
MEVTISSTARNGRRARRRIDVMRRVQEIAIRRFADGGFGTVTVEAIAAEADVAPITVYRHFGTKESLVLWDEFDPPILAEIARRLPREAPLEAIRAAMSALLEEVYDREAPMALARAALIHREPSLLAAALLNSREFASAIAALLEESGRPAFGARVLADAAVAALGAAVDEWQRQDARVALAQLIDRAFDALGQEVPR